MSARIKQPPGVMLSDMPGLNEAMAKAVAAQNRTREDAMLNLHYDLCGLAVRTMTVVDYVCLDRSRSPFLNRLEPSQDDLSFFLWMLSPQHGRWYNLEGWRKHFPTLQAIQGYWYGRKVRRKFCRKIPESSEAVVVKCFEYIGIMFFDAPASVKNGAESCLSYLTAWFDALQSEYNMPTEEIWKMGLPELFQRLKAIRQRSNPSAPNFSKYTDELKGFVVTGLRQKRFTLDDLKEGKVKFPDNFEGN